MSYRGKIQPWFLTAGVTLSALLGLVLWQAEVQAQQEVCFCHNIVNNPVTICTDNQGLINGHMGHVDNGTDTLGECVPPTPTPTVTPTATPTTTPTTTPITTPTTTPDPTSTPTATPTATAIPQKSGGISLSCRVRVSNNAIVSNTANIQTNTGGNSSNNNTQGGSMSSGKIKLGFTISNRVNASSAIPQCPSLNVNIRQRNRNTGPGSVNQNNT